ncbi:MoaD/ThiS family protein [Novosphingobium aquiterrae]|uniref:MoaD/ThiS family protein n=1 Tax=Novosphingobium aquiterrae TaxID=624388 RepID=A0ABV6PKY6_9SPHN
MATLVFLGRLADVAGATQLEAAPGLLANVLARLPGELAIALLDERVRIAHNGVLVSESEALIVAAGDEVAFLPPVSGG